MTPCDPMIHWPDDPWAEGMRADDCRTVPHSKKPLFLRTGDDNEDNTVEADNVVQLDAAESIVITELTPADGRFVGKRILRDGRVLQYPQVKLWQQAVTKIPATIPALYGFLKEARLRNVCLIRGTATHPERKKTRRQLASEERDHGFVDTPTRLHFFDIDGAAGYWRDDPAAAVHRLVIDMGPPWSNASYVWFFSAGHGLKMETIDTIDENNEPKKVKVWKGEINDSKIRVRLAFILDRPVSWREAALLTDIVAATSGLPLDDSICRTVQPNYVTRPRRQGYTDDVLGEIETIGVHGGAVEVTEVVFTEAETPETKTITPTVTVPADLPHRARWAAAQGHGAAVADHPDALTAVLGIGSDGRVRQHMMAAVVHLLRDNPAPEHISAIDHGLKIADELQSLVEQRHEPISVQLAAHGRSWGDVDGYLAGMADVARWIIERPGAFRRRTIRLEQDATSEPGSSEAAPEQTAREPPSEEAQKIFDRVERAFETFFNETKADSAMLLVAPTGSRKSTLINRTAVRLAAQLGDRESIVILVSRHQLGDELIEAMHREHPNADFTAAIWRGRHAEDPEFIGPLKRGETRTMCWRSPEARAVEAALLKVEDTLCSQGSGDAAIKCPFHTLCGVQRQKRMKGINIWVGAHELQVHRPPKAFGKVVKVFIDENPLDAFVFGVDAITDGDKYTLDVDELLAQPDWFKVFSWSADTLVNARAKLHRMIDAMALPFDPHRGEPLPLIELVKSFRNANDEIYSTAELAGLEWRDKQGAEINPTMKPTEVEQALTTAADNVKVKKFVTLWTLLGQILADSGRGRILIHRGNRDSRIIRMCGLREIAEGWQAPTLISDATGDPLLLQPIWRKIECDYGEWKELPKPASVAISQIVDRPISKWAVAVEGAGKERIRRERAARKLYAAALATAMKYGGAKVGLITYKSTEAWIRANCHVPGWLTINHFGAVEGTNELKDVRALIIAGRPLANPEALSRIVEALFGEHVEERDYQVVAKGGRMPVVANAAGTKAVLVDIWQHRNDLAKHVRWQVTEGSLIQAEGRARSGLRGPGDPLDIHRWHDVPLPRLGEVTPQLWKDVAPDLDDVMVATGGVWIENVSHAAKAYPELFTAKTLESARNRAKFASARSPCIPNKKERELPISNAGTPLTYQLAGSGQRPTHASTLLGLNETKAWLEAKLGPLARFDVVYGPVKAAAE